MMKGIMLGVGVCLAACAADDELSVAESPLDIADFELPAYDAVERASVVHLYESIDPSDQVPRGLLEDALVFFDHNRAAIPNDAYVAVVDMSRHSGMDRFWLIDTATGLVEPHKVAHGSGSDPENVGIPSIFSNVSGSNMTSLGFYLGGEIYDGTHPHSMRLDGLSADGSPNDMANTNARDRLVVMHEADYVDDANTTRQGRSNGCLALDPAIEAGVADRLTGGALIYTAITPLADPVGRARCGDALCDGGEDELACPADCALPDVDDGDMDPASTDGGCATGGQGAGLLLALATVGLRRRHRS
jgi:hypothetical protein